MISEKLNSKIKDAMKNKQSDLVSVLRMLSSALKQYAIDNKKREEGLTEEDELKVLQKEAKKRKDSISQYQSAGREDLAQKEKEELKIIEEFLPEQLSEEEVRKVVKQVISQMGEVAPSQFGQVMGTVMGKLKNQADGTLVKNLVQQELNQ